MQWLGQANAAIDVQLTKPGGVNAFNSGGIGVDYGVDSDSAQVEFVPPAELSFPDCSPKLQGTMPSQGIPTETFLAMEPRFSDPFKRMIGHPAITVSMTIGFSQSL